VRYYLDTEFHEDGKSVTLISIGLVAEDGRELYAVSTGFDPTRCNDWVKANVLPKLPPRDPHRWMHPTMIALRVHAFVGNDPAPEFWAYYADYDWVLFCQLFGAMVDLPKGWPMLCLDLKQYAIHLGIERSLKEIVPMPVGEHDALCDARWNSRVHRHLMEEQARRWVRRG
jgi:hypothetical protein